jgi:UDP-GlcNAc:undecaprenyl-phosphate GlcNAc-1-phosphate transferase
LYLGWVMRVIVSLGLDDRILIMLSAQTSAFIITALIAFCVTLIFMPLMIFLGKRYGIVAKAGGRHINEGDERGVSKLGGVAVFLGFTTAVIIAQYLNVPRFDPNEIIRLIGLLSGGTLMCIVGVIDDKYELSPLQLGTAQIIVAGIAVLFQIIIETFNNPLTGTQVEGWPYIVTVTLSMFWLGLMMNTVNFMDGLDGLVGGIAFIAGIVLFIHSAFILNQVSVSLLPLALAGSSFAFLLFNFYPAQVFLGGGAMYLGFIMGSLAIIGGAKMATILLVMGLPLMDLTWQAFNRMRQGKNPMVGDRGHIHFRLQDIGFTQRQIVLIYYLFCAFFGVLTLITSSQIFKFVAFSTMVILIMIGFILVAKIGQGSTSS